MAWTIEFDKKALKEFSRLEKPMQKQIDKFLLKLIKGNPRDIGTALKGKLSSLWRYRTGDYRIICELEDKKLVILVVKVKHRKSVYK